MPPLPMSASAFSFASAVRLLVNDVAEIDASCQTTVFALELAAGTATMTPALSATATTLSLLFRSKFTRYLLGPLSPRVGPHTFVGPIPLHRATLRGVL